MKVVFKNRKTGLYFKNAGETDKLELACISTSKTKWSYQFYEQYEPFLYSDELKLLRKQKIEKIKEIKKLNQRLGEIERIKFERYIK